MVGVGPPAADPGEEAAVARVGRAAAAAEAAAGVERVAKAQWSLAVKKHEDAEKELAAARLELAEARRLGVVSRGVDIENLPVPRTEGSSGGADRAPDGRAN